MASLSAREESFIELMMESEELQRRGVDLLLKRPDYIRFFDPLKAAGLFDPERNPEPRPLEEKGFFQIPYWSALDYLVAAAAKARQGNDVLLAEKVMAVVRSVSIWEDAGSRRRDNYQTSRRFAEILGLAPPAIVTGGDLDLIPGWLESRFDRGTVGRALDEGVLATFLRSDSPSDWDKAVIVLRHCTAIRWMDAKELGEGERKPTMPIEDYWLSELVSHHAAAFGQKVGCSAAQLLLNRTREVFGGDARRSYSYVYRPAVEDHAQNHSSTRPDNVCVQGLRDILLSWCRHDSATAKPFVADLLESPDAIVRRIGIYVVDQHWEALREIYFASLGPQLFDWGHLHELYNLLSRHFGGFTEPEKAKTLRSIEQIPVPDDGPVLLRRMQRQWLSAIYQQGYEPADRWYQELNSDTSIGKLGEHPTFQSYAEVWSGPGPTPYTVQELLAFASAGTVVEKLNKFQQVLEHWRGPTTQALVETLQDAVRQSPNVFVRLLPRFLTAKRPFQYGVINGLRKAWETTERAIDVDWPLAWEGIVTFLEQLLGDESFWSEPVTEERNFGANRNWIPSLVAELLIAGTKDDLHAYPERLLPRALTLITILLQRALPVEESTEDAMFQAINSLRGKAIEALINHALRTCRIADKATGCHDQVWEAMRPVFDSEVARCKDSNYEFSTLAGAYLENLLYMDSEWVRANLQLVFPAEYPENTASALDGLAHSGADSSVYPILVAAGVFDRALRADLKGRDTLDRLVEMIAVAYVRGEEVLDSSRFGFLFDAGKVRELEIVTRVFWSVRGENLSVEQRQRVVKFWERCAEWASGASKPPAQLMSGLGTLASYLDSADGRDLPLLLSVAPYVHINHRSHDFFEQISRFAASNPEGVSQVLRRVLEAHVPDYDYENRLKTLLKLLAEKGRRPDANEFAELGRGIPGMQDLYDEMTRDK